MYHPLIIEHHVKIWLNFKIIRARLFIGKYYFNSVRFEIIKQIKVLKTSQLKYEQAAKGFLLFFF